LLLLPTFIRAHSSALPFPLLFLVVFQWCSLHSCRYELQNFVNTHNFQQQMQIAFNDYPIFFLSLNIWPVAFMFLLAHHLLINAWFLKLIRPITTSLGVSYTTTWKHFMSSLWMNVINFIFQLFQIINLPLLTILTPPCLPCTPFTDCAHLFVDYVNSFNDYENTLSIVSIFLLNVATNLTIARICLMTRRIFLLI
jgi:hypothetical protein